ncbi:hypothetical protein [Adhaeretor mobilis]|uniref:Uncharacterized protein n=1 Tax=Adhaeretor mobilis TaxID=1930276 RepID=A0A517N2F2_9BACT|nr:hypothetical protein [Adhaeretor mobilis]QDT01303.1 hypothetical protein HG15A2_46450 [Adhaeretor mobilis]
MPDILFHYERVNPSSWAYLSSLLMLALFFKFNRIWSLRNIDLFLLIALAPGLLLVQYSFENVSAENALPIQKLGFIWLFVAELLLMLRMLMDPALLRRPLLDPNLNTPGLLFLGGSLLFFLMANVVFGKPSAADLSPAQQTASAAEEAEQTTSTEQALTNDTPTDPVTADAATEATEEVADEVANEVASPDTFSTAAPGFSLLYRLPRITTQTVIRQGQQGERPSAELPEAQRVAQATARVMAILSHFLIVVGLIVIGIRHFENPAAGVATATMYLMLPYTALFTGSVAHALPASLLVWAVVLYRRPTLAGMMIGMAAGTIYYPAFLIPLWCSYYWARGVKRFITGMLVTLAVLVITQAATAESWGQFLIHVRLMFGIRLPIEEAEGVWQFWSFWYRMPILAAFVALAFSFTVWPMRKNLGSLICCSAALMLGAQFWHAQGGGLYIAWFLPLVLLAIFRPNLSDTIAARMVPEGWWQLRLRRLNSQAEKQAT